MIKDKTYFLSLDYDIIVSELSEEDGGGWFARYADFSGVMGDGDTKEDAISDVKRAFESYIDVALKYADSITEPHTKSLSKRINITLPENLLATIDEFIKSKGISRSAFLQQAAKSVLH